MPTAAWLRRWMFADATSPSPSNASPCGGLQHLQVSGVRFYRVDGGKLVTHRQCRYITFAPTAHAACQADRR